MRRLREILASTPGTGHSRPADPVFDAQRYWEDRYASSGNSGDGSSGRLAEFKASVVNGLLAEFRVDSAIEFGCGDGNQLALMRFPRYIGLDISPSAIARCIERFAADSTKSFFLYDSRAFHDPPRIMSADMALSLDVIYHIVSDRSFELYMDHLCAAASRLLVIYSTNADAVESAHIRHRRVADWMGSNRPDFGLDRVIENPYPGTGEQQSNASFFVYGRLSAAAGT